MFNNNYCKLQTNSPIYLWNILSWQCCDHYWNFYLNCLRRDLIVNKIEQTQDQEISEQLLNSLQETRRNDGNCWGNWKLWYKTFEQTCMENNKKKIDSDKAKGEFSAQIEADIVAKEIKPIYPWSWFREEYQERISKPCWNPSKSRPSPKPPNNCR